MQRKEMKKEEVKREEMNAKNNNNNNNNNSSDYLLEDKQNYPGHKYSNQQDRVYYTLIDGEKKSEIDD